MPPSLPPPPWTGFQTSMLTEPTLIPPGWHDWQVLVEETVRHGHGADRRAAVERAVHRHRVVPDAGLAHRTRGTRILRRGLEDPLKLHRPELMSLIRRYDDGGSEAEGLRADVEPVAPMFANAPMIPQTVPKRPMNGVAAAVVARKGTKRLRRATSIRDARISDRSTLSRDRMVCAPPAGCGQPTACPEAPRINPNEAVGMDSRGTNEWAAHPANRARASRPRNRDRRSPSADRRPRIPKRYDAYDAWLAKTVHALVGEGVALEWLEYNVALLPMLRDMARVIDHLVWQHIDELRERRLRFRDLQSPLVGIIEHLFYRVHEEENPGWRRAFTEPKSAPTKPNKKQRHSVSK